MINFDALTLKAFLRENEDFLEGAFVQKIKQKDRREILLTLRKSGVSKHLYININPEFFHICLKDTVDDFKTNKPPMFCMFLRKYVQCSKILKIEQPFGERIIEFYFEYVDPAGDSSLLCLAAELMGKHSNIILYDVKTKMILGCAHNVGSEKSQNREIAGNIPYIYPPPHNKKNIEQISKEKFYSVIKNCSDLNEAAFAICEKISYVTVPVVLNLSEKFNITLITPKNSDLLFENLKNIISLNSPNPCISKDFKYFSLFEIKNSVNKNSVNEMIKEYFSFHKELKLLNSAKAAFFAKIDTQIKKLEKKKQKLQDTVKLSQKADEYKLKGDILMINPYIKVFPNVVLKNPYNNEDIKIELDERLSVVENANKYYKLYKKSKNALGYTTDFLQKIEEEIKELKEERFYGDMAESAEEIRQVTKKEKVEKLKPFKIGEYTAYAGKNASQNDFLLSKISSPEDLWFHPLNMHGAHLILKINNPKETVPDEILLQCAKFTKSFSKYDNNSRIPIIYTKRKYVKKATSKTAFVTYKNEKEIYC